MARRKVLVVVDVQNSIFELPVPLYREKAFLENVASLVAKARKADIPVVFIQHCSAGGRFEPGTPGWQIHPRLGRRAYEPAIEKWQPDGFMGSSLDAVLKDLNASELYLCGFATPYCFDSTIRTAYSKGYELVVVADGHTTTDSDVLSSQKIVEHHNDVFTRFARVVRTADVDFSRATKETREFEACGA